MIRVKFNNSLGYLQAEFELISDDVVQLTGKKVKPNTSGFKVYRLNGKLLGDYSDYRMIVNNIEGCVQFGRVTKATKK